MSNKLSLTSRTLRIATLRIGAVSLCVGVISYYINVNTIADAVRQQIVLSAEQTLQRESLPFREIRELQQNFLDEFKEIYSSSRSRNALTRDFDDIFYRHADGSYTQRPGVFEGEALPDGRRFAGMSATYAPAIPPDDDIKARFALSFILSHKFGSASKGRLFNFYGVVPEKGFPIYQSADIAQVFTYSGPDALELNDYEFYSRGFSSPAYATFITRMYWDYSNSAWMATVATPSEADASGKHRILACVDVLLNDLMKRVAHPSMEGAYSALFLADEEGTLIYHPDLLDEIKNSKGNASIKSANIASGLPALALSRSLKPGTVELVETDSEIIAAGLLPETPWVLTIHYPKSLMMPTILQNLAVVVALGLLTLLVEIYIIRSVLQKHVALPLGGLISAARLVGLSIGNWKKGNLPVEARDEIGELAREFLSMAKRVDGSQRELEDRVRERTTALEKANQQLMLLNSIDQTTGIANRRRFDEVLANEWRRACRMNSYLVLAMIDVDWFKAYNDCYGHPAGDECLRSIAHLLEAQTHRAGDLIARYGGEEFALIVATAPPQDALPFAERMRNAVEQAALPHDMSPFGRVTISIGVAGVVPTVGETPESLVKKADDALYRAKKQGRNQACLGA